MLYSQRGKSRKYFTNQQEMSKIFLSVQPYPSNLIADLNSPPINEIQSFEKGEIAILYSALNSWHEILEQHASKSSDILFQHERPTIILLGRIRIGLWRFCCHGRAGSRCQIFKIFSPNQYTVLPVFAKKNKRN